MTLESRKTNLDKLKTGCLFRSLQKENGEPENIAIGQISKELRFLQRQSEYASEIERVLKELRLTVSLIKESKNRDPIAGMSRQEILAYYQGVFFALVHQIKDKLVQLVYLITEEVVPEKPAIEKDVSVSDLLRKNIKQKIHIVSVSQRFLKHQKANGSPGEPLAGVKLSDIITMRAHSTVVMHPVCIRGTGVRFFVGPYIIKYATRVAYLVMYGVFTKKLELISNRATTDPPRRPPPLTLRGGKFLRGYLIYSCPCPTTPMRG